MAGTLDALKGGDGTNFTQLSIQHGLDCTRNTITNETLWGKLYGNRGCKGGTSSNYWQFAIEQGLSTWEGYPIGYESSDGTSAPYDCRDAEVTGPRTYVSTYDAQVYAYTTDTSKALQMVEKLQNGPLSVVVSGYQDEFRYYGGGIIAQADCQAVALDHQLTLVGYQAAVEGTDTSTTTAVEEPTFTE